MPVLFGRRGIVTGMCLCAAAHAPGIRLLVVTAMVVSPVTAMTETVQR